MNRRRFVTHVLGGALLAATAGPVEAQVGAALGKRRDEITVDAESISYDKRNDTVSASGQVVIKLGDATLRADQVELDRRTNDADASGEASLTSPDGVIRADRMRLNLDEETGALLNGEVVSPNRGFSLRGDRIEKGSGQNYHIENGRFTTCRCREGAPDWSIHGDKLDVALDGYGQLQGGTFNVLDVPVLYLPRAAFPVHSERQSGLLLPRVGFSNRRGFQLIQPYYFAINKSHDVTVGFDVETAARLGLLGEYRYAFSRDLHGQINASYFNEVIRGAANESSTSTDEDPHVPENRWGLQTEHSQRIGPVAAYADLQLVSDDLFLREINTFTIDHSKDVALRTLPFTTSRVGFIQAWDRVNLQGEGVFYQDLTQSDDLTLQRAPELRLASQKQFGAGLMGNMAASVTNFAREDGITGVRGDLLPSGSLRLPLGRSVFGSLRAAFRETAYQLTENEMTGGFRGDDASAPPIDLAHGETREVVELGGDVSSGVSRVFDFPHLGITRLKHTIEPRVEYLFIPKIAQNDLPIFDGIDRINQRSLMTFGFISRLLARDAPSKKEPDGEVYELTRLSVSQSYDFLRTIPTANGKGSTDHFSDIDLALRINPSRWTSVRLFSTYDTANTNLTSATAALRLQQAPVEREDDGRSRLVTRPSLEVAYRFITDNHVQGDTRNTKDLEQLDASLIVPLAQRIGLLYATRYDIRRNSFFENHYGLRLLSACDCWSLDIGVSDKSNPNEVEFRAQLTLVGLGSTGDSRFGSGS